jgi:ribonuclease T2
MRRAIATLLLLAAPAAAAQDFDYWLLALSWSPSWCATEGDGDDAQCAPDRDLGFVLHGLWPQYEEGWPEWCGTPHPDPSGRVTAAMTDVTGSPGLAMHAGASTAPARASRPPTISRSPASPSSARPRPPSARA